MTFSGICNGGEDMERDIAEKQLEEYSDVFADIVNALVFEGKMICQAENLVTLPTESYHRSESGKYTKAR